MFNMGVTQPFPLSATRNSPFSLRMLAQENHHGTVYAQAEAKHQRPLGFEDVDDFVQMNHWYSYEARGHMANNWGDFLEENPEIASDIQLLVGCSGSNSFVSQMVFNHM